MSAVRQGIVEPSLRIAGAGVEIGGVRLLDDVSLDVPSGSILAIVGPNGAGKTTLLDVISGTIPHEGSVAVAGGSEMEGGRRLGVGRVFQGSPLPETLTVAEVAKLVTGDRPSAGALLGRFGLTAHATSFVAELSTGMRRILDLAIATVGSPTVLLLDEPASGLAQSEVELLAELLHRWRDETGAAVIIVEHDAWLVREVADRVAVIEAGRVAAEGTAKSVLSGARRGTAVRLHSPQEAHFREALRDVTAAAEPPAPLPKRTLSKWTLMRLGLREMSAGMSSVLILGVLSRVLKVELGVTLGVVTAVLASNNLAAPIAVAFGHRSDTRPIFGRRRTPYIIGGAIVTGLAVAAAPHVAGRLQHGVTPEAVILSVLLFIAMGIGMYGAGTVFFALLADRSEPSERGHAASVVYLELMIGVLLGVALTGAILRNDATQDLGTLFGLTGVLVVAMSTIAVWGQDRKLTPEEVTDRRSQSDGRNLREAVRAVAAMPMARRFFLFMVLSTLFIFLQQGVLTPFGGEVLHLSVRATSSFSAVLTIGTIAGMVVAGRPFAEQYGHRRVAAVGLVGSIAAFAGLSLAAAGKSAPGAWLAIMFLGFAGGIFNVSSLALMMGMADRRRTALFMGAWTLAHALADGAATAGGGSVFEVAHRLFGSVPGGYAAVFGLEAIGLALCLPLLRTIDPAKFAGETGERPIAEVAVAALAPEAGVLVESPGGDLPMPAPAPAGGNVTTRAAPAARASGSSRRRSGAAPRRPRSGAGS